MNKITNLLKNLFVRQEPTLDEAYLAESVDIYDLERRMRELDGRRRDNAATHLYSYGNA
jgi:hypothetical protein